MKKRKSTGTCNPSDSNRCRLTSVLPAAVAVIASLVLCACGGSAASSKEAVMETAAAAMDTGAVHTAMPETAAPQAVAPEASGSGSNSHTIQPVSASRKLIRTVTLDVETTEFDTLLSSVSQFVTDLGGYLETSDISGSSISSTYEQQRYASLTARIPSDQLDRFLGQVTARSNVTHKSESTQDITLQYSDVESRRTSLTIEQERLWTLLEHADSVETVIALESRLSEIRYQLESLESQLRIYDNQVDYSTVHLSVREVTIFTPTSPDSTLTRMQKGFQKSLNDVGNSFLNITVWFVSNLPMLITLAVIIAIILIIVKLVMSHSNRKQSKNSRSTANTASAASMNPLCTGPPVKESDTDSQSSEEL